MLLIANILIILLLLFILFTFFTFLNIKKFAKNTTTAILLTPLFLYSFFIMPFVFVNSIYKDSEKFLKEIDNDTDLNPFQRKKLKIILGNRKSTFVMLYKSGAFSYSDVLRFMRSWYMKKPFMVTVKVKLRQTKKERIIYEENYRSNMNNILHSI